MKFTLESAGEGYVIHGYDKGQVTINGKVYRQSLILTPDKIVNWGPEAYTSLSADDFATLAVLEVEMVILGTGSRHHFPQPDLIRSLMQKQIGLEAMDTAAACRTYNVLMGEGRRIAAALLMI